MLNILIQAYINERAVNRMLPYKQIADEFVSYFKNKYEIKAENNTILNALQEIEDSRIKYFLKEYIHIRLEKMRKNIFVEETLLSQNELKFYQKYLELLQERDILTDKKSEEVEYVGFICIKKVDGVEIDGEIIVMEQGSFFVANLDEVYSLLIEGCIQLV